MRCGWGRRRDRSRAPGGRTSSEFGAASASSARVPASARPPAAASPVPRKARRESVWATRGSGAIPLSCLLVTPDLGSRAVRVQRGAGRGRGRARRVPLVRVARADWASCRRRTAARRRGNVAAARCSSTVIRAWRVSRRRRAWPDARSPRSKVSTKRCVTPWPSASRRAAGSQCGFCTPGILVRAAALEAKGKSRRVDLDRALAAHLCRCTGWQTVYEALEVTAGPGAGAGPPARPRSGPSSRVVRPNGSSRASPSAPVASPTTAPHGTRW